MPEKCRSPFEKQLQSSAQSRHCILILNY